MRSLESLQRLVDRLLELSKLEQRHSLDHQQRLDPASLVERLLRSHAPRLQQAGLSVRTEAAEGLSVQGEAELLELALSNLLDNAIEFSPAGGVIELSVRAEGPHVCIGVRDHGVGVPDYAWPRLGERFYSTARPERAGQPPRKGSGLGLAIVRQVMALHGGELRLTPAQPGLRAALCLPSA